MDWIEALGAAIHRRMLDARRESPPAPEATPPEPTDPLDRFTPPASVVWVKPEDAP